MPSAFKDWYLDEESNVSDFETYVKDDEAHTEECDRLTVMKLLLKINSGK